LLSTLPSTLTTSTHTTTQHHHHILFSHKQIPTEHPTISTNSLSMFRGLHR
jgi:hypothetical protein